MIVVLTCILGSYFFFLMILLAGWWKMKSQPAATGSPSRKITVVVAMRNEARAIPELLDSLLRQDHPDFEIVLIDDHSSDNTRDVVQQYKTNHPEAGKKIRLLRNHGTGKKAALT